MVSVLQCFGAVMNVDHRAELSANESMLQPSVPSSASAVRQKGLQQGLCATFSAVISLGWQADVSAMGSMLQRFCEVMGVDYRAEPSANESMLQPSVQSSGSSGRRQKCRQRVLGAASSAVISSGWQADASAMVSVLQCFGAVMTVDYRAEVSENESMLRPPVQSSASTVRQRGLQQVLCATCSAVVSFDWQADGSATGSMLQCFCEVLSFDVQTERSAMGPMLQRFRCSHERGLSG